MKKFAMRLRLNAPVFYGRQTRLMTKYVVCEKHKPRYDLVSRVGDSKGRPSWWKGGFESNSTLYTMVARGGCECDYSRVRVSKPPILVKAPYFQHKGEK